MEKVPAQGRIGGGRIHLKAKGYLAMGYTDF